MVYDNTDAAAGGDGSYSFADIYAALGGTGVDILRVDSGTGVPTYRLLKNLQIGDKTTNAAATSLIDTNVVCTFDAGKVLKCRATQTTSWTIALGTKVGTGNQASGKKGVSLFFHNTSGTNNVILRGSVSLYGCTLLSTATGGVQALQFVNITAGAGEIVNCLLQGFFSSVTAFQFGTAAAPVANIYNMDISADPTGSHTASFAASAAERLTMSGNPGGAYLLNGSLSDITLKDCIFFGTPTLSDIRWNGVGQNWKLVRPTWSNNAPKFSGGGIDAAGATNGFHEYWRYDAKCVDGAGAGIASIPVKLTDADGNVQVDTTTNSAGELGFGSGLTTNMVVVMDHYSVVGVYTQHHRSPFLFEVNMPYQTGYNDAYRSHYGYFNFPGMESITTTSGAFEDMNDIFQMAPVPGNPTVWTEASL